MVLFQYTQSLVTFYKPYCKPDDSVDMAWSLESPGAILSAIQMYTQAGLMRLAGRSLESAGERSVLDKSSWVDNAYAKGYRMI